MSLTPDVERRLHSVLDQGIDYLRSEEAALPKHTSSMQSLLDQQYSMSMRESSGTLETILKQPIQPSSHSHDPQAHNLQNELSALQQKISALELKLKASPPPLSPSPPLKPPKSPPKAVYQPTAMPLSTANETQHMNDQAAMQELRRDNERLRQQVAQQEGLLARLTQVQEDYNVLAAAYEKSERLRRKQKELIEKYRAEVDKKGQNTGQMRRPRTKSSKREGKTRSSSKKSVRFHKQ